MPLTSELIKVPFLFLISLQDFYHVNLIGKYKYSSTQYGFKKQIFSETQLIGSGGYVLTWVQSVYFTESTLASSLLSFAPRYWAKSLDIDEFCCL